MTYDAIVLGLGGMGSAALAHLAARGQRAIGFERFGPAHAMGSSHGDSRIIRRAYPLDPRYVPLVLRAYELWRELEVQTGDSLLRITGGLFIGRPDAQTVSGGLASVRAHDIPHELLDAPALRRRFPAMRFHDDEVALYEPESGILFPEAGVLAHVRAAVGAGAEARFGMPVAGWTSTAGGGVRVTTAGGEIVEGSRLIITAGAWFAQAAPDLGLPLQVERNVMHYFAPTDAADVAALEALPVYVIERDEGRVYGFPLLGDSGLKIAFYRSFKYVSPDTVDRTVGAGEIAPIRAYAHGLIPTATGTHVRARVCLYTLTPDEHFVIGLHPQQPQVVLAGGFSGHGYKFCTVVGEIIADLATTGATPYPIQLFDPRRFVAGAAPQSAMAPT